MGKTTISDITRTKNTEDDDASDGNYSAESDFTEVSLTKTMVNADNHGFTIVDDSQDINYYAPLQYDKNSGNEQDNEAASENDENTSSHREASGNDEEIRPDEPQSSKDNDNLIPSAETISNDAHLTNDNDTTKPHESIGDEPTSDVAGSTQTQPRRLTTYVGPVTGAHRSRYTGGYSYAMAALEHIDKI